MSDATYLDDLPEPAWRPTTGTYLSGVAHAGLLTWLIAGWGLSSEPLPFDTFDATVVSTEEFNALLNRGQPELEAVDPPEPVVPQVEEPPAVTPEDPVTPVVPEPLPTEPEVDATPAPLAPAPVPEQVDDTAPVLPEPEVPAAPDLPQVTDTPQEEDRGRVAPQPVPLAPDTPDTAPEAQPQVQETPSDVQVDEPPQDVAEPDPANEDIVTEADIPSGAPEQSVRPPSRPAALVPPTPQVEEPAETAPETAPEPEDNTLDNLLADLDAADASEPAGDPGPPMTDAQRGDFRRAVSQCWNLDPGSLAARVAVTVSFQLGEDRRVVGNIELVANTSGSRSEVNAAFEAARRAILRCQNDGFPLNAEQYEQWRNVEMTFNLDGRIQ